MLWWGQIAHSQGMLSAVTLSGSVSASTTSIDYRYTKHTRSSGGRGSRPITYYTWDPHTDQVTNAALQMILNGSTGDTTSSGTYFGPIYSATDSAMTSLANTASQAVFTTTYHVSSNLNTPKVLHRRIAVGAQAGGTFYFSLANYATLSVTATGSALGTFSIFNLDGSLVEFGPLYGAGTWTADTPLSPGSYGISSSLYHTAVQDTQQSIFTNIGTTSDSYGFTATLSFSEGG